MIEGNRSLTGFSPPGAARIKQREYNRRWASRNRGRLQQNRRAWGLLNKVRELEYQRRYRWDHADQISERRFRFEELERRLSASILAEFDLHGLSIVSLHALRTPNYIFELRGQRTREYFYAGLPIWE